MRQIVLDTETTGLSTGHGHRIIEIGCLELVDRRLTGREFHRFLNPDRDIDEGAEAVHGISRADLENEPRFPEIVDDLLAFLKGAELVIHNASFDVGFLEYELSLMKHPEPTIEQHATVLDTLTLARKIHPGQRNSLDALCKRYSVDATKRDVHGALIDSELLANVYLAMTGGQTALLLDEESPGPGAGAAAGRGQARAEQGQAAIVGADLKLIVVKASAEEAAAHEAMLKKIRKSGACVWDFD
ncbi:MAG: DNA polymerase III subunit epsilon [Gammaproteobacteria bacterium]|nr:DNA polymerase III subunit epsilon [Gammaproteobacteria bacterium]MBT8109620.1 DNA polymerase III subunit epsilon [Gammaproteobacteria bacterium]NND47616.1 DNA polymerase III subunit epsilon [Woeseiaceae bacterium]NNL44323.1 DNA polymerase III subunit epsilon [Woeseiaceae bacterium]